MKKMNKKGFTLIELLAVIVILAIVAAVSMTVVVPMIGGRKEEAAISSVKNMVNQITGACQDTLTADIMAPAHVTFSGTFSGDGTLESCTTGTCTITFSKTDLRAMNISGDLPSTFTNVVMNKCNITSGDVSFGAKDGQFANINLEIKDGQVNKK